MKYFHFNPLAQPPRARRRAPARPGPPTRAHAYTQSSIPVPVVPSRSRRPRQQTWDSWNMAEDQSIKEMLKPLVIGACCVNGLSIVLLSLLAFSDPGILPKHTTAKASDWTYSMQGLSYRPPGAIFCKKTKGRPLFPRLLAPLCPPRPCPHSHA